MTEGEGGIGKWLADKFTRKGAKDAAKKAIKDKKPATAALHTEAALLPEETQSSQIDPKRRRFLLQNVAREENKQEKDKKS